VLKEKFKLIKSALKDWHVLHSQYLPAHIVTLKDRMAILDGRGEVNELSVDECTELHDVSAKLHSLSRLHTSICWQQSRS